MERHFLLVADRHLIGVAVAGGVLSVDRSVSAIPSRFVTVGGRARLLAGGLLLVGTCIPLTRPRVALARVPVPLRRSRIKPDVSIRLRPLTVRLPHTTD